MSLVTLDMTRPQSEQLSPFSESVEVKYPADYIGNKSQKIDAVLGENSPGTSVIMSSIADGGQDQWLNQIKLTEDVNNSLKRNELITELAQKTSGRMPTLDEISVVKTLADDQLFSSDVTTALERNYSRKYTDLIASLNDSLVDDDTYQQHENAILNTFDRAQEGMTKSLIAEDLRQQVNHEREQSGYLSVGADFAKGFIPGYDWYKKTDLIPGASSWLTGNNLDEQITTLYNMPPQQFKETLTQVIDSLKRDNILQAEDFINAVISYGTSDRQSTNFWTVMDALGIGATAKSAVHSVFNGLKSGSKSILNAPSDLVSQSRDLGLYDTTALSTVAKNVADKDLEGLSGVVRNPSAVEDRLPQIFSPKKAFTQDSSMSSDAINKLLGTIKNNQELSKRFFTQIDLVDRLDPKQLELALQEAVDKVKDTYSGVNNHIIGSSYIPAEADVLTNTAQVAVKLGQKNGTLFRTEAEAINNAKMYIGLKTDDWEVIQEGLGGYYIEIKKPIQDVGQFRFYDAPIETQTPQSFSLSNKFINYLRSPDYKLSTGNVEARGRVVHSSEAMDRYMVQMSQPFRGKSKEWVNELDKVLTSNRTAKKYSNTIADFENTFRRLNGKLPSLDQTEAYFTYKQINDIDYVLRDADIIKQKYRLGAERMSFTATNDKGEKIPFEFDGKLVSELPRGSKDHFYVNVIESGKILKGRSSRFLVEKDFLKYQDMIDNKGYKIVLDPSTSTYYLVTDFKANKIKLGSLNYVEGGHNEYRYPHFIKQGDVRVDADGIANYVGDKALYVAPTSKHAKDIVRVFEEARRLYIQRSPAARKFIDDNLPISYPEWVKKVKTGDIDPNIPFVYARRGQRTSTLMDYSRIFGDKFEDVTTSQHNFLGTIGGRYTGEQAATLLDVLKAEGDLVIKTGLEPLLHPLETLKTTTADFINLRVVNDYKLKTAEDWVQQFGYLLEGDINKIRSNPAYYLEKGVYRSDVDQGKRVIAEGARMSAKTLWSYKTEVENTFDNFRDKILSSVYNKFGEGAHKAVDDLMLHQISDVPTFFRAVAYNFKLGFFNPKQLLLQASALANASLVAGPMRAVEGFRALRPMVLMMQTEDPKILAAIANRFSKMSGWDKDQLMEMVDSFKSSGFHIVGNDVSYLDTFKRGGLLSVSGPKVEKAKEIWSHHTDFFKMGEGVSRFGAYAMAYRDWKAANPKAIFDRYARSWVLSRAKNLTTNMTRDSQAGWQKGWTSMMTQFMGYQARFLESLWDGGLLSSGRKFTRQEKLRLVGGMSLLYGVPITVSGVTGVIPARDVLRDWMAESGATANGTVMEPFLDGFVSSMLEGLGLGDYDIASAYGPNGLPSFRDLLNGDSTWYDILSGASGGVMADLVTSVYKDAKIVFDLSNPDKSELTLNDLLEPLRNISTVNALAKVFEAVNTHRYMSRKGTYLTETTEIEALMSALFGVNPDRVSEIYSQIAAIKSNKDHITEVQNEMASNYKKAMDALASGDEDSYRIYKKRADALGVANGLSVIEWNTAGKRALDQRPLDESVLERYNEMLLREQMRNK